MVKRLLCLLPLSLFAANPQNVDPKRLERSMNYLELLSPEKQAEVINNAKPNISSQALLVLYDHSKDQDQFIRNLLMNEFSADERQDLINSLHSEASYSELMINISEERCAGIGAAGNPTYFGAMPVVDWLNTAHFNGFFNPVMTNSLVNREVHNEFNTFNQWNLWIEPLGFYTEFRREPGPLKFNRIYRRHHSRWRIYIF